MAVPGPVPADTPVTIESPGEITPDGCAVDFYAILPPGEEPGIVHGAVPAGASVLELGCGTGRILRPLAALGHPVCGVDESAGMLAHLDGLPGVRSRIEDLRLDRVFGCVLLASTLVNTPSTRARAALLATAHRHLAPGGLLVVQRHPARWHDTVAPGSGERDGVRCTTGAVERTGSLLTTSITYEVGGRRWVHPFTTRRLDDDDMSRVLAAAGFQAPTWLSADHAWLSASRT